MTTHYPWGYDCYRAEKNSGVYDDNHPTPEEIEEAQAEDQWNRQHENPTHN